MPAPTPTMATKGSSLTPEQDFELTRRIDAARRAGGHGSNLRPPVRNSPPPLLPAQTHISFEVVQR
jgi:hypothetical protein